MERRRQGRAGMFFQVALRSHGTRGAIELVGRDFSPDGLFVLTNDPPPAGSRFLIECDLAPVGGRIKAAVRVVRTVTAKDGVDEAEWGAGLEFTEITQEVRACLAEWAAKLRQFEHEESVIEMPGPSDEAALPAPGAPGGAAPKPVPPSPRTAAPSAPAGRAGPRPLPKGDVEVRVRLEGFEYLTRHHEVKMTAEGLFIRTEAPLPTGSRVAIELQRTGEEKVYKAKGQVMRLVTTRILRESKVVPGMSIRVTGCSDETRKFLQEMLEKAAEASF